VLHFQVTATISNKSGLISITYGTESTLKSILTGTFFLCVMFKTVVNSKIHYKAAA